MSIAACQLSIASDLDALSFRAAELFTEESRKASQQRGRFLVILSGGESPRRCYQLLAQKPFRNRVPWHALQIFWGDERFVAASDPRNNAQMARLALLDQVPLAPGQIHPIPILSSPGASATQYEITLREFFAGAPARFDFAFLGLGENGHTASLFPGTPVLQEQERWVSEVRPVGEVLPRITLTAPVINRCRLVVFLVSGSAKAKVLQEVLEGEPDPQRLPAQLIRPEDGRLLWLVDRDGAASLHSREGDIAYGTGRRT